MRDAINNNPRVQLAVIGVLVLLAALFVTGRDLPDQTLDLAWAADAGLWSVEPYRARPVA